ncbi:carboxymuconolactone decarboxylase family protein [Myceligenerans crystallogenes]|uniref:Carboxymuconolactone decarboxylase family protein n=1 Tax=Myceligenerans crystallogenes TaxID=316335 RepID=A0ABN2N4Y7_9MICO
MNHPARVPAVELTGLTGAMVRFYARKRLGGTVPAALGVLWNNRKVLRGTMGIGGKIEKWDACDKSLKSFAHMAVASMIGCTWCLDFNYFKGHDEGLDLDKAREIPRWRDSAVFTDLERDVLAYAEAMSTTEPTVTDEMVDRLLKKLGAEALVELTSVIAFANLTTRTNVALGIESDGFAAACGLKPMAERPATV